MSILSEIYTFKVIDSYRSPAVILEALVPAVVFVVGVLIKVYIDCGFLLFFLDFDIITRGKSIDIDH